jgi:peptide/nickel transport system permease protein
MGALAVVSVLSFLVPYLGQSDPARIILQSRLGDAAVSPAAVAALRRDLGLDQPLYVQYFDWLGQVLQGNLGHSFASQQSVAKMVLSALEVSLALAIAAMASAIAIALPLGILAAAREGSRFDQLVGAVTQGLVPLPEFLLGPFAILVFAVGLRLLPAAGWLGPAYVILPAGVLALRPLAYLTAITRAAMIDVLAAPYITAARARGLSRWRTIARHGVRNVLPPVMTLMSLWFASLVGGSVIVEVVFAVPGTGRLLYGAVINADVPVIQGAILVIVAIVVVINTASDVAYGLLNPAAAAASGSR